MKNLILVACLCIVLTMTACASSDAAHVSDLEPIPVETLSAETTAVPDSSRSEQNSGGENQQWAKAETKTSKNKEDVRYSLSPMAGLELESMYPEHSYAQLTKEEALSVISFYDTMVNEKFYNVYVDCINNVNYGKASSWAVNDSTRYCYLSEKHFNSDYPEYGSYYANYFYNPVYSFLKNTAYVSERPVYLNPVILSDKFVQSMAEDLNLNIETFNEEKSVERIVNHNYQKVSMKPFYYYESEYGVLRDVASGFSNGNNSFHYLEDENLYYTYALTNPDSDSFAVYAVYVKFSEQGVLYSIGIDYCYMPDDFFENYNILGMKKQVDNSCGICADSYSAGNVSMLDDIGFNALKDKLVKYLNSSVNGTATETPEVNTNMDYKVYYTNDERGIFDQYYHVSAWYTIE